MDFRVSTSMEHSLREWTKIIAQIKKNYDIQSQKLSKNIEGLIIEEKEDVTSVHETIQELISSMIDSLYELDTQVSAVEGCELPFSSSIEVINSIKEVLNLVQTLDKLIDAHLRTLSRRLSFGAQLNGHELELKDKLKDFQKTHKKLFSAIDILLEELQGFISQSEDLRQKRIL